jgi:hypothetical protein
MRCPRCEDITNEHPALSRIDNETAICSPCGGREAMEDYTGAPYKGEPYWNTESNDAIVRAFIDAGDEEGLEAYFKEKFAKEAAAKES